MIVAACRCQRGIDAGRAGGRFAKRHMMRSTASTSTVQPIHLCHETYLSLVGVIPGMSVMTQPIAKPPMISAAMIQCNAMAGPVYWLVWLVVVRFMRRVVGKQCSSIALNSILTLNAALPAVCFAKDGPPCGADWSRRTPYGSYQADCVSPMRRAALQARAACALARALRSLWRSAVPWHLRKTGPGYRDDRCRADHVRDCAGGADRATADQRHDHADHVGRGDRCAVGRGQSGDRGARAVLHDAVHAAIPVVFAARRYLPVCVRCATAHDPVDPAVGHDRGVHARHPGRAGQAVELGSDASGSGAFRVRRAHTDDRLGRDVRFARAMGRCRTARRTGRHAQPRDEALMTGPRTIYPSARRAGLVACHACGRVSPLVRTGERQCCTRCGATLHVRKPESIARTYAFLIAAAILYVPANLLPVMHTSSLLGSQDDTIMSGVVYFWTSGDWPLAIIVFVASILVPMLKLAVLTLLAVTAQAGSRWRPLQRTRLFRGVEAIGRWSMLDIFVITLTVALVRFRSLAEITAGPGAVAFGVVVVLTMIASMQFDSRLIWDNIESSGKEHE
ncbi:hypothetical protein DFQ30_000460 [Apophysomyces sp. BC1015]|nr:hypothetical protein DFQ30_000460 [Apophysomyces sp. BC1015]